MLYVLHGTNTKKARAEMSKLVKALSNKKPDAGVFKMDEENFDIKEFEHLLQGQGLFEKNYIVTLQNILTEEEFTDTIKENISAMQEASHIFILFEEKIKTPILKKLEKSAEKVSCFEEKEVKKEKGFEVFSLADAFGKRTKKDIWVIYQKARRENIPPEEIFGILFWQIKTIILSKNANNASEAGVSPYPFKKAKSFSKNFTSDELKKISSKLVETYHSAYTDSGNMSLELEKFLLNI